MLVQETDVASVQPAVCVDRLRRQLGVASVAAHELRRASVNLAVLRDAQLDIGERRPDGPDSLGPRMVDR